MTRTAQSTVRNEMYSGFQRHTPTPVWVLWSASLAKHQVCAGVASVCLLLMVILILNETNPRLSLSLSAFGILFVFFAHTDSYALLDMAGFLHEGDLLLFLRSRALFLGSCSWEGEESRQWIIFWFIQTLQGTSCWSQMQWRVVGSSFGFSLGLQYSVKLWC